MGNWTLVITDIGNGVVKATKHFSHNKKSLPCILGTSMDRCIIIFGNKEKRLNCMWCHKDKKCLKLKQFGIY